MESNIQHISEKVKALSTLNGAHNLIPPSTDPNDTNTQIAIIDALKAAPRLRTLYLELQSLMEVEEGKLVRVTKPIMNQKGAYRFLMIIRHISEETEFSNYSEDEVNERIAFHFSENYPHFTLWAEEYAIDENDFNVVASLLLNYIDSSFHKSKDAKLLNTVRGVYSENALGKFLNSPGNPQPQRRSALARLNPFGGSK